MTNRAGGAVLLLGLDCAGKSTVLRSLLGEDLMDVSPTLGFDIRSFAWALADGRPELALDVWDVGGQETIRAYWRNYFEETDGLVWVVDSADVERLELCAQTLRQVLGEERLLGASLLILANKQDLGGLSVDAIEAIIKPKELGARHCAIMPCSAVTGQGVREAMEWLVADVADRVFVKD